MEHIVDELSPLSMMGGTDTRATLMLRSSRSTRSNAHAAVAPADAAVPGSDKENAPSTVTPASAVAKPASALSLLGPKRTGTAKSTLLAGGGKAGLLKTNNNSAAASAAVASSDPINPATRTAPVSLGSSTPLRIQTQDEEAVPAAASSLLLRKPATLLSSPLSSPSSSSTPLKLLGRPQMLSTANPSPAAAIRDPVESPRAEAPQEAMDAPIAPLAEKFADEAQVAALNVPVPSITLQPIPSAAAAAVADEAVPALAQALADLRCSEPAAVPVAALPSITTSVVASPASGPALASESGLHITSASASLADPAALHSFVVAGRSYRKLTLLGKGGCGEVWRVQCDSGRTRALKRMHIPAPLATDADGKAPPSLKIVADFANEIRILQRFSATHHEAASVEDGSVGHGHVLRLLAHEVQLQPDGSKLVSLLLEEGGSCLHSLLTSLAKSSGNLTQALDSASAAAVTSSSSSPSSCTRRALFRSLCHCVAKVHRKGVAHLDLKPANFVQLTDDSHASSSNSGGGFPTRFALIDFGIARIVEGADNAAATRDAPQGSFNYMAPESLSLSSPAGRPADIWALGVLLFSLVYSTRAIVTPFAHFKSASEKDEARKISVIVHSTSEPAPPAAAAPAASSYSPTQPYHIAFGSTKHTEAVSLIRWCMRNRPEERPSIEQVLAHPFVTGEATAGAEAPAPAPAAATSCSAAAAIAVEATAPAAATAAPLASASYLVTGAQLHSLLSSLADRRLSAAALLDLERSFLQQLKPAP